MKQARRGRRNRDFVLDRRWGLSGQRDATRAEANSARYVVNSPPTESRALLASAPRRVPLSAQTPAPVKYEVSIPVARRRACFM